MWVSCVKAVPTVVIVFPWLLVRFCRGERLLPSGGTLAALVFAGLLGQYGGNVLFQWSLGIVGIALTVPLCMGAIILCSAFLGRIFVNEPITPLTLVSLLTLIIAIWSLSLGAGDASQALITREVGNWQQLAGVAAACCAGLSYAVMGVVVRYAVAGRAAVSVTVMTTSLVGLLAIGGPSAWRLGWEGISAHSWADWRAMLLAGLCNFVAYLALTRALQLTTLVTVNALNASQVAMAAVAGVLLFGEAPSQALAMGVALTVFGLLLMPRQRPTAISCSNERFNEAGVQKSRNRSSSAASSLLSCTANGEATAGCSEPGSRGEARTICSEE